MSSQLMRSENFEQIKDKYQIYQFDHLGLTPLHWAVKYNLKEMTVLLLQNNSNVNKIDFYNRTSLFIACKNNNVEIANLLIQYGAKNKVGKPCQIALDEKERQFQQKFDHIQNELRINQVFIVDDNIANEKPEIRHLREELQSLRQ